MRVPGSLATDVRSLDALKTGAAKDPSGAVKQAASQFEALFMQMVLKSMRDAVPKSGMLEGTGADVYASMLDTQFAQAMSGRPGGLSEMIAKQLMRGMKTEDSVGGATARPDTKASIDGLTRALLAQDGPRGEDDEPSMFPSGAQMAAAAAARARAAPAATLAEPRRTLPPTPAAGERPGGGGIAGTPPPALDGRRGAAQSAFVDRMWDAAAAAERSTGVPAGFIVGQAALETGWGRAEIRHADGRSAHNLFGIKAGPGWRGETVEATTTEFVDGRAVKTVERFRAYNSHEASFADWAKLMASNPRYAGVLQAGGSIESFSRNLQKAGYATDPDYASKLTRTITQALTLRREST
ncbi:MAG: flagellar assembly peptidoglycan hydrolase FlgJ [Burkholderiales bacterium]|jgi:flagellar protein FlgJ